MAFNKRTVLISALAIGLAIVLLAGIGLRGRRETMASRSAAALREATRKGEPVGGSTHGGHDGSSMTKSDMSAHGTTSSGASGGENAMPGMAGMQHETAAMPGMAGMQHGTAAMPGMVGMQHGTSVASQPPAGYAGMQHGMSTMPPAGTPWEGISGSAPAIALPEAKAAEASPGQPARTLLPDPLDQPAETSVLDATRALEMASEMGGMAGMEHGGTSYRQLDAGRDSAVTTAPEGGNMPPESSVTPQSGAPAEHPHGVQHGSPQPTPTPVPGQKPPLPEKKPSTPAPTHPPHQHPGGEGRR